MKFGVKISSGCSESGTLSFCQTLYYVKLMLFAAGISSLARVHYTAWLPHSNF